MSRVLRTGNFGWTLAFVLLAGGCSDVETGEIRASPAICGCGQSQGHDPTDQRVERWLLCQRQHHEFWICNRLDVDGGHGAQPGDSVHVLEWNG